MRCGGSTEREECFALPLFERQFDRPGLVLLLNRELQAVVVAE